MFLTSFARIPAVFERVLVAALSSRSPIDEAAAANELAIRRAFEAAGVEFTKRDQPGVCLTKAAAMHSRQPVVYRDSPL